MAQSYDKITQKSTCFRLGVNRGGSGFRSEVSESSQNSDGVFVPRLKIVRRDELSARSFNHGEVNSSASLTVRSCSSLSGSGSMRALYHSSRIGVNRGGSTSVIIPIVVSIVEAYRHPFAFSQDFDLIRRD